MPAVENLDDCASINHNWLNGHNACWTWTLLRRERQQAAAAIEDCREMCRWGGLGKRCRILPAA